MRQSMIEAIQIRDAVMSMLDVNMNQLTRRHKRVILAKAITLNLVHQKYNMTYSELAELVKLTNHASVIHHLKKHNDLIEWDAEYRAEYYKCSTRLGSFRAEHSDQYRLFKAKADMQSKYDHTVTIEEAYLVGLLDRIDKLEHTITAQGVLLDKLHKLVTI